MIATVEGAVGLSRPARLRKQIQQTSEIYKALPDGEEFSRTREELCRVIEASSRQLRTKVDPGIQSRWNFFSPFVGLFMAAVVLLPSLLIWGYRDELWGKILIGLNVAIALMFFVAGVATMREKVPVEEDRSIP